MTSKSIALIALGLTIVNFFGLVILIDQYNNDKEATQVWLKSLTETVDSNTKLLNVMSKQYEDNFTQ